MYFCITRRFLINFKSKTFSTNLYFKNNLYKLKILQIKKNLKTLKNFIHYFTRYYISKYFFIFLAMYYIILYYILVLY